MTYFEDMTEYKFLSRYSRPGTKNIGWLEAGCAFPKMEPSAAVRDTLWAFCSLAIAQTRGIHRCGLCEPASLVRAERNRLCLHLGSAEIRVFSRTGDTYAAPNMIYHYVVKHHYQPPIDFLRALTEGPVPPSEEYFEKLQRAGIEWRLLLSQRPAQRIEV